jgi:hypothetical protein
VRNGPGRKLFSVKRFFLALLTLAALAASLAVGAPKEEKTKQVKWKITGQLEEACSCDAACPCWFGSKPTKATCAGNEVIFIQKGTYGNVKLDGLAVANYVQSPEKQTMMDSFGKWNFSTIYVDEKANPDQRKALEAIAAIVLPSNSASKNFKTVYAPITRIIEGKDHIITIGNVATFTGHLVEGGLGGSSRITNPPGADPLHHQYAQGKTTKMTYNDSDQNWDWTDTNYMLGTFTPDSDQYAKFVAGLAQKMAAKEKTEGAEKK